MNGFSIDTVQENWSEILSRLTNKERVALYRNGILIGAIVPQEDLEVLEDHFYAEIADRELQESESFSWESVKAEAGLLERV